MSNTKCRGSLLRAALVAAALLAPAPALAAKGTAAVLQVEGGYVSAPYGDVSGSCGFGVVLGVGGKLKKWRPVFYLIGIVSDARYRRDATYAPTGEGYTLTLSFTDLGVGGRVVVPVIAGFRLHFDVSFVGSRQAASVEKGEAAGRSSSGWTWGWLVGGGAEYRWHRNFGTGVRAEGSFYHALVSRIPSIVGAHPDAKNRFFVGLVQSVYF